MPSRLNPSFLMLRIARVNMWMCGGLSQLNRLRTFECETIADCFRKTYFFCAILKRFSIEGVVTF